MQNSLEKVSFSYGKRSFNFAHTVRKIKNRSERNRSQNMYFETEFAAMNKTFTFEIRHASK